MKLMELIISHHSIIKIGNVITANTNIITHGFKVRNIN